MNKDQTLLKNTYSHLYIDSIHDYKKPLILHSSITFGTFQK